MVKLSNKKLIFSDGILLITEKLFRAIFLFFIGIMIAKALGNSDYGTYSEYLAYIAMFSSISLYGLEAIAMRAFAGERSNSNYNNFYLASILLRFLTSTIALVIVCGVVWWATRKLNVYFIYGALIIYFSNVLYISEYYLRVNNLSKKIISISLFQLTLSFLIKLYGIYTNKDMFFFMISASFDAFLYGCGAVYFTRHIFSYDFHKGIIGEIKRVFIVCTPLWISGMIMGVYRNYDILLLSKNISIEELGEYSLLLKLIIGTYFVPVVICNLFLKKMILSKKTMSEYYSDSKQLFAILCITSCVIYLMYVFILIPMVNIFLKSEFGSLNDYKYLVGAYVFIIAFDTYLQNHFINKGIRKYIVYYNFMVCLLFISSSTLLVKEYGVSGVVFSFLTSIPAALLVLCVFSSVFAFHMKDLIYGLFKKDNCGI